MRISDWSSDVCSSDLRFAPRLVHEEAFERREALHGAESGAADRGGGAAGNAEQTGQTVGGEADHQIVEPAPALIAREQRRVAEVEAQPRALDQPFGERRAVAHPEVEPLPRADRKSVG